MSKNRQASKGIDNSKQILRKGGINKTLELPSHCRSPLQWQFVIWWNSIIYFHPPDVFPSNGFAQRPFLHTPRGEKLTHMHARTKSCALSTRSSLIFKCGTCKHQALFSAFIICMHLISRVQISCRAPSVSLKFNSFVLDIFILHLMHQMKLYMCKDYSDREFW